MHSVKSETKCITTIGIVNSRLADTPAIRTAAKLPSHRLLTRTLTRGPGRCELHYVESIFGLGLGLFAEKYSLEKYRSHAFVFY